MKLPKNITALDDEIETYTPSKSDTKWAWTLLGLLVASVILQSVLIGM